MDILRTKNGSSESRQEYKGDTDAHHIQHWISRDKNLTLQGNFAVSRFFRYIKDFNTVPDAAWHAPIGQPMKDRAHSSIGMAKQVRLSRHELHSARKIFIGKVAMHTSDCRLSTPPPQGLYHPKNEHDACGMGLVASIRGEKSHDIIRKGLEVLINLTHRGAAGCDPETGDGAGILIQIPHVFFARECGELGMQLPEAGAYGVAMVFSPSTSRTASFAKALSSASPRKKA